MGNFPQLCEIIGGYAKMSKNRWDATIHIQAPTRGFHPSDWCCWSCRMSDWEYVSVVKPIINNLDRSWRLKTLGWWFEPVWTNHDFHLYLAWSRKYSLQSECLNPQLLSPAVNFQHNLDLKLIPSGRLAMQNGQLRMIYLCIKYAACPELSWITRG